MIRSLLLLTVLLPIASSAQTDAFEGEGSDVVDITKPKKGQPYLLEISGNLREAHFSITSHDNRGRQTGLLVNTTESYEGLVAVDLGSNIDSTVLEVTASGKWEIFVYPIQSANRITGSMSGQGDNVLWVTGKPTRAQIDGNDGSNHFAVTAHNNFGRQVKLLANTTDPYSGRTLLPPDVLILTVKAVGDWTISLE